MRRRRRRAARAGARSPRRAACGRAAHARRRRRPRARRRSVTGTATQTSPARYSSLSVAKPVAADARELGLERASRRSACGRCNARAASAATRRRRRAAGSDASSSLPLAVQCSGTREPGCSVMRSGHAVSTRSRYTTSLPSSIVRLTVSPTVCASDLRIAWRGARTGGVEQRVEREARQPRPGREPARHPTRARAVPRTRASRASGTTVGFGQAAAVARRRAA